ncbi:hypothetical protein ACPA9J_16620 [Pseudomonas aeruginosa]
MLPGQLHRLRGDGEDLTRLRGAAVRRLLGTMSAEIIVDLGRARQGRQRQRHQGRRAGPRQPQLPLVHGNGKLVSVIGLEDIVVVETKDAMMIAHKDRVQDVKHVVKDLDAQGRSARPRTTARSTARGAPPDSVDMGGPSRSSTSP